MENKRIILMVQIILQTVSSTQMNLIGNKSPKITLISHLIINKMHIEKINLIMIPQG
jgi:hypothetical protein